MGVFDNLPEIDKLTRSLSSMGIRRSGLKRAAEEDTASTTSSASTLSELKGHDNSSIKDSSRAFARDIRRSVKRVRVDGTHTKAKPVGTLVQLLLLNSVNGKVVTGMNSTLPKVVSIALSGTTPVDEQTVSRALGLQFGNAAMTFETHAALRREYPDDLFLVMSHVQGGDTQMLCFPGITRDILKTKRLYLLDAKIGPIPHQWKYDIVMFRSEEPGDRNDPNQSKATTPVAPEWVRNHLLLLYMDYCYPSEPVDTMSKDPINSFIESVAMAFSATRHSVFERLDKVSKLNPGMTDIVQMFHLAYPKTALLIRRTGKSQGTVVYECTHTRPFSAFETVLCFDRNTDGIFKPFKWDMPLGHTYLLSMTSRAAREIVRMYELQCNEKTRIPTDLLTRLRRGINIDLGGGLFDTTQGRIADCLKGAGSCSRNDRSNPVGATIVSGKYAGTVINNKGVAREMAIASGEFAEPEPIARPRPRPRPQPRPDQTQPAQEVCVEDGYALVDSFATPTPRPRPRPRSAQAQDTIRVEDGYAMLPTPRPRPLGFPAK